MIKNNKNHSPKEPNYRLRRTIAAGTAIAGLMAGGLALNNKMDDGARRHYDKIETEALKEANTGWNAVVVLHEGATFRTAPKTANSGAEEGPDTVAGRVGEGEVLRIDRPIAYVEQGINQSEDTYWFGFTLRGEKGQTTGGADNENVYWVNFSQLQRESTNERSYVTVYDYPAENGAVSSPANYNVIVDSDGNFTNDLGERGGSAATASTIPENIFDQMVTNEHLELSHGK